MCVPDCVTLLASCPKWLHHHNSYHQHMCLCYFDTTFNTNYTVCCVNVLCLGSPVCCSEDYSESEDCETGSHWTVTVRAFYTCVQYVFVV